jgi:subtilisin family serine protease
MRNDEELIYAQTDLGIADPMLEQQWHLINRELKDVELNVTGLWARGVTGAGVKVALIDDGLDMHSDDLKDNFVREIDGLRLGNVSLMVSLPKGHTISTIIRNCPNRDYQTTSTVPGAPEKSRRLRTTSVEWE